MASYNHFFTPNSQYPDCTDNGRNAAVTGPRSFHPGGVNILMLDGHVQFIKDTVSLTDLPRHLDDRAAVKWSRRMHTDGPLFAHPRLLGHAVRPTACPGSRLPGADSGGPS